MWTIIRKEALENFLTLRFVIGFAACVLTFGLVTYVLMQDFQLEWANVEAAKYDQEQEIRGWEVYSQVRPVIIKTPSLLAVYGSDLGRSWGKRVYVSHTRIPVFTIDETSSGISADFLGFFYSFDFITVIQIFISLLALLFSFDLISAEKQQETLKLVLSNPVKRTYLFVGKFLGALLTLVPVLVFSFLVSFIIYLVNLPAPLTADNWVGLLLVLLAALLYGAVFIAIGMLVSVLTHRKATSLIVCMILWVFLVLIVPNAVGFLSSELGFSEDAREFDSNLSALYREYDELFNALSYRPMDYMVTMNSSGFGEGAQIYRIVGKNAEKYLMSQLPGALEGQNEFAGKRYALESEYFTRRMQKTALTENLMRFSPSSLFANITNALTATDAAAHRRFIERARNYREEIIAYIEGKGGYRSRRWFTNDVYDIPLRDMIEKAETMTMKEMGEYFNVVMNSPDMSNLMDWIERMIKDPARRLKLADMPRFTYNPTSLSDSISAAAFDLFLMVIIFALIITVSYIKFLRYDPR
jgi:ABC-type transport system involved in multi-copper enzyme maturation permease subunit